MAGRNSELRAILEKARRRSEKKRATEEQQVRPGIESADLCFHRLMSSMTARSSFRVCGTSNSISLFVLLYISIIATVSNIYWEIYPSGKQIPKVPVQTSGMAGEV